jgi:hypothetical protein
MIEAAERNERSMFTIDFRSSVGSSVVTTCSAKDAMLCNPGRFDVKKERPLRNYAYGQPSFKRVNCMLRVDR